MNSEVSVSIIIPTYNSEGYIAQAIESVLHQTYNNFEIIVVDDASTDSTLEIARSFSDKRLKIIANQQNRGVSYGRNCGIKQARGEWIGLLDSDDWYAPQRLEKLLSIGVKHNADLIADDLFLIREREINCWSTLLRENGQTESSVELIDGIKFVESDRLTPISAERKWSLGYMKPLIRRDFLIKNQLKYNENLEVGEDFTLYLDCLRHQGKFYLVPQPYYYYRTRAGSLSTRKPTEYLSGSCRITRDFILQESLHPTDEKLLDALSENLLVFQRRLDYYSLIENIKEKKIITIIRQVFMHPYILDDVITKLVSLIKRKIILQIDWRKARYSEVATPYSDQRRIFSDASK